MKPPEKNTGDYIFLWLMHNISEKFKHHAILKGGMMLRLLDCPRKTIDLDYVFVPFNSKKEITAGLLEIVNNIEGAKITKTLNSKSLRIIIQVKKTTIQIDANVSDSCKSTTITTSSLARKVNEQPHVIRIMSFDVALSHKLAAWNERRLIRDLYDIYYIYKIIGVFPDLEILKSRLTKIESRLPAMKKIKTMSLEKFKTDLSYSIRNLSIKDMKKELIPLLNEAFSIDLELKIKSGIIELIEKI